MNRLKTFAIASCLAALAVAFLPSSKADEWNKKTILTINEPLAIPGMVLQPGKYVMKLADSQSNRHIVQVYNQDESKLETTILAIPNYRLQPTGDTQFGFWEMPAGQPKALKAWFYPGDNFGQEFAYPKELATQIAQANSQNVPAIVSGNAQNGEVKEVTPSGQMAECNICSSQQQPSTSTSTNQPSTRTGTGQTSSEATNQAAETAPPAPSTPAEPSTRTAPSTSANEQSNANVQPPAAPAPANENAAPANRALPRTASPFPLVGLAGLLSLGAAIVARVISKQLA